MAEPAKRSRLRVWLAVAVLAQLIAAGVLAGLSAVGWFDPDDDAPAPGASGVGAFAVDLPAGWIENLRWGQRLVEQVDPGLVGALVYYAGLPDGAGGYDPTLSVLREPLPSGTGLAEVAEAKLETLRAEAPRADVTQSQGSIDGLPTVRVVVTDPPDLFGRSFVTAQTLLIHGDEAWALQCEQRTPAPSQRHAEAWEACGAAIEGFRFLSG